MNSSSVDIRPLREITADALFGDAFFDDLFVPGGPVVDEADSGWPLACAALANEGVTIATGGAPDKCMEHLLEVIGDRALDGAEADRLDTLIVAAQVSSLLGQLIVRSAGAIRVRRRACAS